MTATAYSTDGTVSSPAARAFSLVPPGSPPFDTAKVTDTFVAGGNWTRSLSADWLGNGHMVVLTQLGLVFDVDPATGAQQQILDLRSKVHSQGEAGALDIVTDPAGTGFYVYYAVAGSDRRADLAFHRWIEHRAGDLDEPRRGLRPDRERGPPGRFDGHRAGRKAVRLDR